MDIKRYREFLGEYVLAAIQSSDGSPRGIYEALVEMRPKRVIQRHYRERERALEDAQRAFDQHRHWPLEIILSHLGLDENLGGG